MKKIFLAALALIPVLSFSQKKNTTISVVVGGCCNYHSVYNKTGDTLYVTDDSTGWSSIRQWVYNNEWVYNESVRKVVKIVPNTGVSINTWELYVQGAPSRIIMVDYIWLPDPPKLPPSPPSTSAKLPATLAKMRSISITNTSTK